ncbi:hypothetical protein ACHAXT_012819 [Thalassiosira profunda]
MFGPVPEEKVVDILTTLYLVGKEGKLTMHLAGECVDCWGCPWRIRPAATCRRKTGAAALDAVTAEEERKRARSSSYEANVGQLSTASLSAASIESFSVIT